MIVSMTWSCISSFFALLYKTFLPVKSIDNAVVAHISIIKAIGTAVLLLNILTMAELNVPVAI